MKRATRFLIPPNWQVLISDLGLDMQEVLAHAGLPPGLFTQQTVQLTPAQYFQFWCGVEAASDGLDIPLKLAEAMSLESFDVPIFAAVCSANFNAAIRRLREYKLLIGPMVLDVDIQDTYTEVAITCYGHEGPLPKYLNLIELVFFTQLVRLATRKTANPIQIILPELPANIDDYTAYFGCKVEQGDTTSLRLRAADACLPFLTSNNAMLDMFDRELQRKLSAVGTEEKTSSRVYDVLIGALANGECSVESVAAALAMSKRTLQRKLSAEKRSFQSVLQQVRQSLAEQYLNETNIPIIEVSFLLGFQESNSFIRAYHSWTGQYPNQARAKVGG